MKRLAIALAVIATAAIVVAPVAQAKHSSHHATSHAKRVARWEHRFHFKLTKANALADADADGVPNATECQNGTNPKSADTNHDGRHDGAEDHNHNGVADAQDSAAKVTSFTAATATAPAVLVITLVDGTTETGTVTDATELRCKTAVPAMMPTTPATTPTPPATTRHDGGDQGDQGDDNGDNSGPGSDDGGGDGDGHDGNDATCTTAALTVGTVVHSAELRITSAGREFTEIELIK